MIERLIERIERLRDDPERIVDWLRYPRALVVGNELTNRAGLQAVRSLKERAAWSLRSRPSTPAIAESAEKLERDGFCAIENFLPDEDFARLEEELKYIESLPDARFHISQFGVNYVSKTLMVSRHPDEFPAFARLLTGSNFAYENAMSVARRTTRSFAPTCFVQHVFKPDPDAPYEDYDYNSYLHVDRHYRFMKAFFYLRDVPIECAPYSYVRGSHLFNWERLRFDYKLGIEQSRSRSRNTLYTSAQKESDRAMRALAEGLKDALGLEEVPLPAKKNTLLLSDNAGLHRRSEMVGNAGPRVTANLDYKFFESIAHPLYPLLKKWA